MSKAAQLLAARDRRMAIVDLFGGRAVTGAALLLAVRGSGHPEATAEVLAIDMDWLAGGGVDGAAALAAALRGGDMESAIALAEPPGKGEGNYI